ncbi:ATPase WRNIP1-like [Anneissia japonica]|uniref:ATPase WRNIP1-like n=1 Tax=Anneissia japonica TaxID=1529436 RepID=UPI0014258981|nr:ATPase WRNIP1-like [Anneissia japonica]
MLSSSASDVECPICGISVNCNFINAHVDICLKSGKAEELPPPPSNQKGSLDETPLCSPNTTTISSTKATVRSSDDGTTVHPPASKKLRVEGKSEHLANQWQSIFRQPQNKNQASSVSPHRTAKSQKTAQLKEQTSSIKDMSVSSIESFTPNVTDSSKSDCRLNVQSTSSVDSKQKANQSVPLAERMRPVDFGEYIGQHQAIGRHSALRTLLETDQVPSCILWGPPGCGKTSLAHVIASKTKKSGSTRFVKLSATTSNLSEVKNAVTAAKNELKMFKRKTILFIDEIHRFNKLQQDAFLPHVENGTITLIGATTENPSFRVNSALLSRCRVVVLDKLPIQHLEKILERGANELEITILKEDESAPLLSISNRSNQGFITQQALTAIGLYCDGDARTALNTLELIVQAHESNIKSETVKDSNDDQSSVSVIDMTKVKDVLQRSHVIYDRTGDEHFNCISALIKSMRGSDANAALYWLGRMMLGGEDPLFVARRLVAFASEDVGLADAQALPLAVATYTACHYNGMPECQVNLSHCVVYLARAPKSTESYAAYNRVKDHIQNYEGGLPGVPIHLRNASTKLMKDLGYGKGYNYRAGPGEQSYLPEEIAKVNFFKDIKR